MKESKITIYIKILINFLFMIAVVLFLFLLLPRLLGFFMPVVVGWVVSLMANPLVHFLEKKVKLLRKHSTVIIIVVVILAITGVMALVSMLIFKEAKELVTDLTLLDSTSKKFSELSDYIKKSSEVLPDNLQNAINNLIVGIKASVKNIGKDLNIVSMDSVELFAKNVAEGFLYVIVTILSAYFFTVYRDELAAGLKKHLPASAVNYWHLIYDNFKSAFGGYFKAQFKIMLVLTVIMFVGFEILSVRYSFLLALGIAFLDFLPVFGTGCVLWPWAVIDMVTGNYIGAIGLVVIYLICQIVKQLLQPKMVGDSIGLHPLATLIFLFVGYKLYGVLGMIIGIPVGMVLVNLYRVGMFDRLIRGFKTIAHDLNEFRKF